MASAGSVGNSLERGQLKLARTHFALVRLYSTSPHWVCSDIQLPNLQYLGNRSRADTHRTKRAWPVFDWDNNAKDAGDQWSALVMAFPEALTIMDIVHLKAVPDQWDKIYPSYFRPDDKPGVEKLFRDLIGALDDQSIGDGTGSPLLAHIWVTNKIVGENDPCELHPDVQVAWLSNWDDGSGRAVMRFCPIAFKFPLLADIKCEELSDIVSGKMSSLAGIIVHELT